jgi:hypothetical protein
MTDTAVYEAVILQPMRSAYVKVDMYSSLNFRWNDRSEEYVGLAAEVGGT